MPTTENIAVEGLAELEQKLTRLEAATAGKQIRSAMMFASTPMLKAAKAYVPYNTPDYNNVHLRDSLGRQAKIYKGGGLVILRLGEKPKKVQTKQGLKKIVYGHLIEFGRITKKGTVVAATPFLRPAFDNNVKTFLERFKTKLAKNIEKALK